MHVQRLLLGALSLIFVFSCSEEKPTTEQAPEQRIFELPLQARTGFGHFRFSTGGMSTYSDREDNPWKNTYLSVTGVPTDWTETKLGDIETNIYQSVYQNVLAGKISQERYEDLQKTWDWVPDTQQLTKDPIKTKIAFAHGIDADGEVVMVVDANNNLDFSDDQSFTPATYQRDATVNADSLALSQAIEVEIEQYQLGKKQQIKIPLYITYMPSFGLFMNNIPQYMEAELEGEKIAISSGGFMDVSYKNPQILWVHDSLETSAKVGRGELIGKDEFIEIKGEIYRNLGVKLNDNLLTLEKMDQPKSALSSTQMGYQSFPFEGAEFTTQQAISSKALTGKYVLLDFWAVWCGPCLEEIPAIKALYDSTDRSKFEVISIVAESDPENLTQLIEKHSINWPQVLSTDTNPIKETYRVNGFPTTFLIDPQGVIVGKDLRGEALEERIAELGLYQ